MTAKIEQKAVIYARVSSAKQKREGHGLDSQETRCREYAAYKSYHIVEVFKDDFSGASAQRPAMQSMLAFLRKHRNDPHIVIIDDISRLARGLEAHLRLRADIGSAGGRLESPSIEFGEDSDSQLVEHLLASVSQHQRQKNAEQVKNRMRARTMNGYWCFQAPVGYRYAKVDGHGKMLIRHEPVASLIAEALEGFAAGRFQTQTEVQRFLVAQPHWKTGSAPNLSHRHVDALLTRAVYAGYIDLPEWGIVMQQGKHEPLISMQTYRAIQTRLKEGAKAPARKDLNKDFPLRGFVVCGGCGKPLQGCWSKGRTKSYPYYLCAQKSCPDYGKSIKRDKVEGEFIALLKDLRPSYPLFALARDIFHDLWNSMHSKEQQQARAIDSELAKIDKSVNQFLDRIGETETPSLISAYEKRIHDLEERRAELREYAAKSAKPGRDFHSSFRTAMTFLANPYKLWVSGKIEYQRTVLKLAFADRIAYVRNEGFRTALTTLPFTLLSRLEGDVKGMVGPAPIEW